MGGKGGRKRKGEGVPIFSFEAGGQGGRFGGLLSPSPTPSAVGWETDEGDVRVGVSQEAVAKVSRLGVAESVADMAVLVEDVERLEVAIVAGAAARLRDKVVDVGRNLPGVRDWFLGLAEEALREVADVRKELSAARAALEKVEYHLSAKVPMLGSDEKGLWVGVYDLRWEIIASWSEKECADNRRG